jgi:hypothetical protein
MDWAAILPSMELASRFLNDPAITSFFGGLLEEELPELNDPILEETHDKKFYRWDYDKQISPLWRNWSMVSNLPSFLPPVSRSNS